MQNFGEIFSRLDLDDYLADFSALLARQKPLFLQGDTRVHFENIECLARYEFEAPEEIENLDDALMRLSKQAVLHVKEIAQFARIISYFTYLRSLKFEGRLGEWIAKIEIPPAMSELARGFDKEGELKDSVDERLGAIRQAQIAKKAQIDAELRRIIYSKHVTPYLADTQIHFINSQEALLARGGFNHALKGTVVARSSGGYFYVVPEAIERLKREQSELLDRREEVIFEHCKRLSLAMNKALLFLKFINGAFDQFDAYQARVRLARARDYEFALSGEDHKITLKNFAHPALKNPKSVSVDFSKKILLVTGVNAGGKSMLLKSVLSAALLAKYLLPMKIDAARSKIGSFKEFDAVIEDPQSVKNDISTFAGRMVHFSRLFSRKNLLIGIDEIELGTDFEEAASLYGVIIERLAEQDVKMIITTHHKRLAMLLAKNPEVELVAALYDEAAQRPRFEFLGGTIGKSYAFETAARYGIPANLVAQAKEIYGEDKENLNEIITKTLNLQTSLDERLREMAAKEAKLSKMLEDAREQKERNDARVAAVISRLEREYLDAIKQAKSTINLEGVKDKQRSLNAAHEKKQAIVKPQPSSPEILKVGDRVKYEKIKGVVLAISKNDATIESEGIKLRVPIALLRKNGAEVAPPPKNKVNLSVQKPKTASVTLDLHGLRADEALARLDKFISDSLVMGFDEVLVYHGIGTGKLSWAVKNFLKEHPSVKGFSDAPPNQGGFGAKVIRL